MRVLNELIRRTANQDDECKGRFKSQTLLNEAAVLASMVYVDINPIFTGIVQLPEGSDFRSIQQRLFEFLDRGVGRTDNIGHSLFVLN